MAYGNRSRRTSRSTVRRGSAGRRRSARRTTVSRRRASARGSRRAAAPRTLKIVVETTQATPARDYTGLMTMAQSSATKRKGKF